MTEPGGEPLLELRDVRISYVIRAGEVNVVPGLSFALRPGEALGLVGESGCGKSTVALAIMRYLGRAGRVVSGRILFEGRDLARLGEDELRRIRGRRIAMVYQDPAASLNPVMTVGRQLMEVPMIHAGAGAAEARQRALRMLAEVDLSDPESVLGRYPHQLSGGQQQRIVIAMALIAEPALLIMDEPTTGLDVTVEAAVLDLVRALRGRHNSAILFISHNLGTVVRVCDRVGVMYGGELVEEGSIRQVFADPRHPYTRGLFGCLPALGRDKRRAPLVPISGQIDPMLLRPPGCGFAARCAHVEPRCTTRAIPITPVAGERGHRVQCLREPELPRWERALDEAAPAPIRAASRPVLEIEGLQKLYRQPRGVLGAGRGSIRAVNDVSLGAAAGETLAIVGESGSGKSTLAKVLSGLETATAGHVRLAGREVGAIPVDARPAALRRALQMVFQNPDGTLNPSHSVGYAVTQRVAIARALAGDPEVVVADEPVSALDVSVQAAIINLLCELQAERAATLVFISHDLAVVRYLADHVAVMYRGTIAEFGPVEAVFEPPYHPYTEALLSAVPVPDPDHQGARIVLEGALPSATELPRGCPFATRCPRKLGAICDDTPPPEQRLAAGHRIACHIPAEELARLHRAGAPALSRLTVPRRGPGVES